MKNYVLIFLLIGLLGFCSSCSDGELSYNCINDVFILQNAQINSFDPLDAYHDAHIQIVKQVYNTLTDVDINGEIIPSLAKSWKTNDGIRWTFQLRNDILFSSDACFNSETERLFSARDVKYSFSRLLEQSSKSLGVSYFGNINGFKEYRNGETEEITGLIVESDTTIVFLLSKPDFNFPSLLALPFASIVKKEAVVYYNDNFKLHPVGTGPFCLLEYKSDDRITLSKNVSYWETNDNVSLPVIDTVNIYIEKDDNRAFLMFKNRVVDFLELNLPLNRQLSNTQLPFDYSIEVIDQALLNFYLFNLENVEPSIRKGVNYGIGREGFQEILGQQGKVTKSLYPKIFPSLSRDINILSFSHDSASKYLDRPIQLNLVCFEDALSRALAEYISRSLEEFDIQVNIESVSFPILVDKLNTGKYDLIQLYWGIAYSDVRHFLNPFLTLSFPPSGNNFNKYSNLYFDSLVEKTPRLDKSTHVERYLIAQDTILNDMPFYLAYYKNSVRASNQKYTIPIHPLGYRLYKFAKESK